MTAIESAAALRRFGYTAREASFLATAALHSGYFLARQFLPARGKAADQFCRKVLNLAHGTAVSYVNRTRLFHLSAKPIYAALGQSDNRHRRRRDPDQIVAKLMALDFVLQHPGFDFLPTEDDKLRFFLGERGLSKSALPTKIYAGKGSNTSRFFVDKYPIRLDPATGKIAFCFIDDNLFVGLGFSTWLTQYAPLIRALGNDAEVVYVAACAEVFRDASRLFVAQFPSTSAPESPDLLAYFETRKRLEITQFRGSSKAEIDAYKAVRRAYIAPRFEALYTAWLGSTPQSSAASPRATFSTFQLPFAYRLFGSARAKR